MGAWEKERQPNAPRVRLRCRATVARAPFKIESNATSTGTPSSRGRSSGGRSNGERAKRVTPCMRSMQPNHRLPSSMWNRSNITDGFAHRKSMRSASNTFANAHAAATRRSSERTSRLSTLPQRLDMPQVNGQSLAARSSGRKEVSREVYCIQLAVRHLRDPRLSVGLFPGRGRLPLPVRLRGR